MSDLVQVLHPIVHRYIPARGRSPKIGLVDGTTTCRLRHATTAPTEVARIGHDRIYACDGAAWMQLQDCGEAATPKRLRALLEHGALATRGTGYLEPYHREVERSPIHYRDDVSHLPPKGSNPTARDRIVEDGTEQATQAVQGYLNETFLIHEDRVFTRFRHLVMASQIHRAAPMLQTRTYPRMSGEKDQIGLRHDRVDELIALKARRARISDPETRDWNELRGIPAELLDDYDIEYAANALPGRLRLLMGYWEQCDPRTEARARIHAAIPLVRRLAEDSRTHAITGDRIEPALVLVRDLLRDIVAEQDAHGVLMMRTPSASEASTKLLCDMVDRIYLPRWRMGSGVAPEDDAALGGLAL